MRQRKNTPHPKRNFKSDESGGLTIQGLFLFGAMAILSAVALDVAKLMSAQSQLQATADAAGHAALYYRETHDAVDAKAKAIEIATAGMATSHYGEVLSVDDIQFGNWDYATETFTASETSRDAVKVTTARLAERSNSVGSYLFRLVGKDQFDVATMAVFTTFRPMCFREGFVADGVVDIQSNNAYSNGFCVHSNEYVSINTNNTFEPGTIVSMPDMDTIDLPRSGYETNDGLQSALRSGVYRLRILNRIDVLIDGLESGDPEYIPDYIFNTSPITLTDTRFDETDFTQGRIHVKYCYSGSDKITITATTPVREVVLVTNCEIKFDAGTIMEDAVIATRHTGAASMNSPSGMQAGRDDSCLQRGGAQLITKGSINFASDLKMYGGQLLALGDIEFSANADGIEGASMVAGGTLSGTSNMMMAFCGSGMEDNFVADYFRLAW